MQAMFLALALALPGQCETCSPGGSARGAAGGRPAPAAVWCPHYTPPVRWFCKPCAGCAGDNCLSCQQPYFGSAPYNYRVQFDYPWSQEPVFPLHQHMLPPPEELLETELVVPREANVRAKRNIKPIRN